MEMSHTEKQQFVSIADSLRKRYRSLNVQVHFLACIRVRDFWLEAGICRI
jgi:hypothetical protein